MAWLELRVVEDRPRLCSPIGLWSSSQTRNRPKFGCDPRSVIHPNIRAKRGFVRAAGIDFGKIRVGLAVTDELGLMAHARPHLSGKDVGRLVEQLAALARQEQLDVFVVGHPLDQTGQEGPAARRARAFAQALQVRTGCRVVLMDERYTTKQASQQLRAAGRDAKHQRDVIDSMSAVLMLQTFLDAPSKATSR